MPARNVLLCVCLAAASGVSAGTVASPAEVSAAVPLQVTYRVEEQPAQCPADTHPQGGCVWLIGKALESGTPWPAMRRIAIVGTPAPGLPAGCNSATTTGVLSGSHGSMHFKGEGYYCPKTDTAWYGYTFDAAQARRLILPLHGSIRYVGSSNTETFTSSAQ